MGRWTYLTAACLTATALAAGGCGSSATAPGGGARSALPSPGSRPAAVPVHLQLELPLVGLSGAPVVSYASPSGTSTLRGSVIPSGATVFMLGPDGSRQVVNPRADGRFAIPARLLPGENTFKFTAARLGARSVTASLAISFIGPAADAMRRRVAADPAKYMAAASAGLNRRLPGLGNLPAMAAGSQSVTFSLNPIQAGPPPASGGPGRWLGGFELTEYYPALEAWFRGAAVSAAGLPGRHRIDWLYSARGLSMEGDGIGLDGRQYHVSNVGSGGWLTATGGGGAQFGIGANAPYWRTGGFWRTATGTLTFPLGAGGWSAGNGVRYVPPPGITFATGQSRPLSYLRSVAVDPSVIPFGSHIFIPSYAAINGGWFEADDTGGAIIGRHIDVFRPPPADPSDLGNFASGQSVYIVPPGAPLP